MGETTRNKGFVVNENGEIVRNRKCPKCGRSLVSEGDYCEYCGAKIIGGRGHPIVWVCVAAILVVAVAAFVVLRSNGNSDRIDENREKDTISIFNSVVETNDGSDRIDENRVMNTIKTFNDAVEANDFSTLLDVFSENVTRFHDVYNISNSEVVEKHRNYDSMFGVQGKHISVRWNTLQIKRISDSELSVVFEEDYSIDRVDKSKYSLFLIEKHMILDNEYRIKSIYDVQLSKRLRNPESSRSIDYGTGYRKMVRPISTSVNEDGKVCVEVHVMPDGTVSEARVINNSKHKTTITNHQIQQQCVQVAKQAKYESGKEELRIIVFG